MKLIETDIKLKGELTLDFFNVHTKKHRIYQYKNMVVTTAKTSIAQRLAGDTAAGEITYCALGTGTTSPALGNTTLQTELFRKLISSRSVAAAVATFQTFYTTSEANGALKEAGLFGNATAVTASATPDSGQLFCRTIINRTKTSSDTLTLSWAVTLL